MRRIAGDGQVVPHVPSRLVRPCRFNDSRASFQGQMEGCYGSARFFYLRRLRNLSTFSPTDKQQASGCQSQTEHEPTSCAFGYMACLTSTLSVPCLTRRIELSELEHTLRLARRQRCKCHSHGGNGTKSGPTIPKSAVIGTEIVSVGAHFLTHEPLLFGPQSSDFGP